MRIISFMVRQAHHARLPLILSLSKDGLTKARPPPKVHAPPGRDDGDLQLQTHADTIYGDPAYTWDEYIQS